MYEDTIAVQCVTTPTVNMLQASSLEHATRTRATITFWPHQVLRNDRREAFVQGSSWFTEHSLAVSSLLQHALTSKNQLRKPSGKPPCLWNKCSSTILSVLRLLAIHKASIADHTCILLVIDLPFKPHFISPSSVLPSSPSAWPGGMHEAVE